MTSTSDDSSLIRPSDLLSIKLIGTHCKIYILLEDLY